MEQLFLIEIFIDKLNIFISDDEDKIEDKNFIIKINFGPKAKFIITEGQLAKQDRPDDMIQCDDEGRRNYSRSYRIGKSYLFPSYPDMVLRMLEKFPLKINVWNDDEKEVNIFVGVGTMEWDKKLYESLKEIEDPREVREPFAVKQTTMLWAECCCKPAGTITLFLRISVLGASIVTEFQQLLNDPNDSFVFRTNRSPTMIHCKRIEGDDPNFVMVGSLYETTTIEDPEVIENAEQKIEICTQLQPCGTIGTDYACEHPPDKTEPKKKYSIEKIKMGDIVGPCGNANCELAHKIKTYIRNLKSYKKETVGILIKEKDEDRNLCGVCRCEDERSHRDTCPVKTANSRAQPTNLCHDCGRKAAAGGMCEDKKTNEEDQNKDGSRSPSKKGPTQVTYLYSVKRVPSAKESKFNGEFTPDNLVPELSNLCLTTRSCETGFMDTQNTGCKCSNFNYRQNKDKVITRNVDTDVNLIYNYIVDHNYPVYNTQGYSHINDPVNENDCTCNALKRTPSCGTSSHCRTKIEYTVCNVRSSPIIEAAYDKSSKRNFGTNDNLIYNNTIEDQSFAIYNAYKNCTEPPINNDCSCNPPKQTPPCRTFDCDCLSDIVNTTARLNHKSYCPLYKHKPNCPVTMSLEEDSQDNQDEVEDKVEPLPYGLPRVRLGPCPILGRPCSVPDGFARMYRNANQPPLPPSHSEAGKVCCSTEYWRIKKAIKEYLKNHKNDDFRCLNRFNVDTERRCCDKEQALIELMGKSCCGSHKLSIQDKYKDK